MKPAALIARCAVAAAAISMAWPLIAGAQESGKVKHIVYFSGTSAANPARFACFKDGLRDRGWIEGKNIAIEQRSSLGRPDLLPALAEEIIRLKPDLVVTTGTPASQAMRRAPREVPMVFLMVSDPVASGIVKSLARPEANVTGISNFLPATTAKLLEFIRTVVPKASRVAFLYDPANAGKVLELQQLRASAPALGMVIEPHELRGADDIESAFTAMTKAPPDALIIPTDNVTLDGMRRAVALAAKIRRPAIYQSREYVDGGGLMSYGLNVCQHFRHAAIHVDKVLKGANPADLPVELPTTFELIINQKTAKALGITIPQSLLARADELIH